MDILEAVPIPDWLAGITSDSMASDAFPLHSILEGSLYYPSSGFDGRPVQYLGQYIHSFIYADYGQSLEDLECRLDSEGSRFLGYEILGRRSVRQHELVPKGWRQIVMPGPGETPPRVDSMQNPYCEWFVFQRTEEYGEDHGPERFSLLYLSADGSAAYQALFNETTPKAIAIIQPGTGFGGNYTDFCDPEALFARSVRATGSAMPEIMLNGGISYRSYYEDPVWSAEFDNDMGWLPGQNIHVWGRCT